MKPKHTQNSCCTRFSVNPCKDSNMPIQPAIFENHEIRLRLFPGNACYAR